MDLFNLMAPFYERLQGRKRTEKAVRRIIELAQPGASHLVLDLGGGTGRVAQPLVARVARVVVLDASRGMLVQAARKNNVCPLRSLAEAMPFPDAVFDLVLCVDAFHHFHSKPQVVRELTRVVKPGGLVLLEEPDINKVTVKLLASWEHMMGFGSVFYSPAHLKRLFHSDSLRLVQEAKEGMNHYLLFQKS